MKGKGERVTEGTRKGGSERQYTKKAEGCKANDRTHVADIHFSFQNLSLENCIN